MDRFSNFHPVAEWKILLLLGAIITLMLPSKLILAAIGFLTFILFYFLYDKKFVIFFIVVSFIMLTTKINPSLRTAIQIVNYFLVSVLFLKEYGLNFSAYPRIPKNFQIFIFFLLSLMLISSFNSDFTSLGLQKLFFVILFFYLIYLVFVLIRSDIEVKILLGSIILCSIFSSLILFYEGYQFGFDLIKIQQEAFSSEAYIGKNNVGVIISVSIIFCVCLLFDSNYKRWKNYFIGIIIFLSLTLIITASRASILFLGISLAVIIYTLSKKVFKIGLISILMIVIVLMLSPLLEFILFYLRVDNIGTGREYLIGSTVEVIKNNLWLGAGPAATKYELYKNLPYLLGTPQEWVIAKFYDIGEFNKTHNFYLYFFSDLGIFGFILAVSLPIIFFRNCYKILQSLKKHSDKNYYLIIGIIGSGIFIFSRGLFEQTNIISYGHIYYDLPFWIIVSIQAYYFNRYVEY